MQTTAHILMIRPVNFSFNEQTAVNNAFQIAGPDDEVQHKAAREFEAFVENLRRHGIDVLVVDDTPKPHTPDSIFPNNWISFHEDGSVVLYPMFAPNRRLERKTAVLDELNKKYKIRKQLDYTAFENQNKFLEGTGSMVLDREKKIAYACISPRTDKELFMQFCEEMSYHPVFFSAFDQKGGAIYHTNVMMCVGDRYVVICIESITNEGERNHVVNTIENSGKEVISITHEQMNRFAGNMLQVNSGSGEKLLVMSTQAYHSLTGDQLARLKAYNRIIHSPIDTIERNGGGSARCMMAEIHLTPSGEHRL